MDERGIWRPDGRPYTFVSPEEPEPAPPRQCVRAHRVTRLGRRILAGTVLAGLLGAAVVGATTITGLDKELGAQQKLLAQLADRAAGLEQTSASLKSQLSGIEQITGRQLDVPMVAARIAPSIVMITTARSLGSGFVALHRGDTSSIVTNYHVVADAWRSGVRTVLITVHGRSEPLIGNIERVSQYVDLALVTVPAALPALPRSVGEPVIGEPVVVAGSPRGLAGSVTSGVVSAVRTFGRCP